MIGDYTDFVTVSDDYIENFDLYMQRPKDNASQAT